MKGIGHMAQFQNHVNTKRFLTFQRNLTVIIMVKNNSDESYYSPCRSALECEMNKLEKYNGSPIYFDGETRRYSCHGLRDTLAEGKHNVEICPDIEMLNKDLEKNEEILRLKKKYGN